MQIFFGYPLLFLLLFALGAEPALANKFQTISGGVSGLSQEKIRLLQNISLYAGIFLIVLVLLALATRKRFEGFIGYAGRGKSNTLLKGAITVITIGLVFILLSFI